MDNPTSRKPHVLRVSFAEECPPEGVCRHHAAGFAALTAPGPGGISSHPECVLAGGCVMANAGAAGGEGHAWNEFDSNGPNGPERVIVDVYNNILLRHTNGRSIAITRL